MGIAPSDDLKVAEGCIAGYPAEIAAFFQPHLALFG
jgi:hypothetical protein